MTEAQRKFLPIVDDLWLSVDTGDVFLQFKSQADGSVSWTLEGHIFDPEYFELIKKKIAHEGVQEFKRQCRVAFL